jgi:hypothetical protein
MQSAALCGGHGSPVGSVCLFVINYGEGDPKGKSTALITALDNSEKQVPCGQYIRLNLS